MLYSLIIIIAFFIDILFGDPRYLPHPIRLMGNTILKFEPFFRRLGFGLLINGILFSTSLILLTIFVTFFFIEIINYINPILKNIVEIVLLFYCISANSLSKEAMGVYYAVNEKDYSTARDRLQMIVSRDVSNLSESDISRAAVETVAENLSDGFIAPLFYYFTGGIVFSMTYKMVNTLDSMVGYKNEKYLLFGKASARLDDLLNYIPARISVIIISIASQIYNKMGISSLKVAISEGSNHKSPNSGLPEASFAGALKIKLGGPDYYHGTLLHKPFIGKNFDRVKACHIKNACDLMYLSSMIWIVIIVILLLIFT